MVSGKFCPFRSQQLDEKFLTEFVDSETDTFAENTFRNDPSKVLSITIPMIVSADIIRLSMWPN